jgi:hypothetical protein
MARMKMVDTDTVDPELKDVFEKMKQRGTVLNVWRMMAWSPALAKVWAPFARGLRNELSVPRRLRELLIVQIACRHESRYEYGHHAHGTGRRRHAGTAGRIAALARWRTVRCRPISGSAARGRPDTRQRRERCDHEGLAGALRRST